MKKRLLSLLLIAVMLLTLTGCGCKHTWSEADCLNASVCSECGETQGEALGHSWTAASCEKTETCSRCGEERGEALGHSYGDWVIGETDMSRSCTVCGREERRAINREIALASYLTGNWNATSATDEDDNSFTCYDWKHEAIPGYMNFSEDGSGLLTFSSGDENGNILVNDIEFSWKLAEYDDDYNQYAIELTTDEGPFMAVLDIAANGSNSLYAPIAGMSIGFTQNPEVEEHLLGHWSCIDGAGNIIGVELLADGSMKGNINGEVSGKWYPMPVYFDSINYFIGLSLRCESEDEDLVYYGEVDLCGIYEDPMEYMANNLDYGYMTVYEGASSIAQFERKSPDHLALEQQRLDEAPALVIGDWQSTLVFAGSDQKYSTEYSVSFKEDGSFTAHLDEDISGSWELLDSDALDGISYVFVTLSAEGYEGLSASISYEGENEPMLSIYLNQDNVYTNYMFFKN